MQLVINTVGSRVRRRSECFLVETPAEKAEFAAHRVTGLLFTTASSISYDAVLLAHEHGIDVQFADCHGEPIALLWHAGAGVGAAVRRRQLEVSATPAGFAVARDWVVRKIVAQAEFLGELRLRRPGREATFDDAIAGVRRAADVARRLEGPIAERRDTLMGQEGNASRLYFGVLARLMPAEYRFDGRSRRPARDPFNAMLNYAYGLLYGHARRAALFAGLDPSVGFLHADGPGRPCLALDLVEPFRHLADRAVVLLFTGRRAKADFFERDGDAVRLTRAGRAAVVTEMNERMGRDGTRVRAEASELARRLLERGAAC